MSAVLEQLEAARNERGAPTAAKTATAMHAPWVLRALLLAGCAISVALVAGFTQPAAVQAADADLMRLLRGMALIKAGLVAAALGVLWWRAGHPVDARIASGYAAGLWWMAGASVAIWQLSHIVIAAGFFHAGMAALLWAAWRDGGRLRAAVSGGASAR